MLNSLRFPLRNISPEAIQDLQEKYPNATVQIKLSKTASRGSLDEAGFWALISMLDWSQEGSDEAVIEPVVAALAARPVRQIYDFKDWLSQKLYLLDGMDFARHIGEGAFTSEADFFSADNFLYARCAAVANGRDFFENVRKKPSEMPKNLEFAPLLDIAPTAHERKTGKKIQYLAPWSVETFSNEKAWPAAEKL